jgi:5-methylcytosine-specific restriction endonuclease McrA
LAVKPLEAVIAFAPILGMSATVPTYAVPPTPAAALATALDSHVLVLNRLWLAIRVVDARRAFSLLSRDLAEVIRVDDGSYAGYSFESWTDLAAARDRFHNESEGHYDWVRTVHFDIPVPKIIRLLGYDRLPDQGVKLNRRNIFARDRNTCQYCGKHFPTAELSLDHVLPRSQGGGTSWENLVCCCTRCNARKGGRTPTQAHMPLIRKPVRPRRNPVLSLRVGNEKYASWKTFLDNAYWSVELK